ncbi:unnamed protein product [Ambrosiozyma monospora]|uniref:Unnamed protein product n=1 Tax=Ambrosiozyma monospora TaxID=43982 RepID=A0ACB5SWM5_AMBMO|nr:unnamed protein product [Ambrosiozyma monospora]
MTVVRIDSSTQYPPPITATPSASPPSSPGPSFSSSGYFSVSMNRNSAYRQVLSSKFLNYSTSSINDEELGGKKIVSQHVLYGSTNTPSGSVDLQIDDEKEVELSDEDTDSDDDENEFALPSYTHPELKKSQLHFDKDVNAPLPAPVDRIFYISPYGEEIYPLAQSRVIKCLTNSDLIIYSIGSLMTSIVPILILQGVGEAIISTRPEISSKKKVLLLNGTPDRETQSLDALGFLNTITKSLKYSMLVNQSKKKQHGKLSFTSNTLTEKYELKSFVTHLVFIENSPVKVDVSAIKKLGVECVCVPHGEEKSGFYNLDVLYQRLNEILVSK